MSRRGETPKIRVGDIITVNGYADVLWRIHRIVNDGETSLEFGFEYNAHFECRRVTDGTTLIVFEEDIVILILKEDYGKKKVDNKKLRDRVVGEYTTEQQAEIDEWLDTLITIKTMRSIFEDDEYLSKEYEVACRELFKINTGG